MLPNMHVCSSSVAEAADDLLPLQEVWGQVMVVPVCLLYHPASTSRKADCTLLLHVLQGEWHSTAAPLQW
jgi:predicted Kef-type K+ transport protein